MTEKARVEADQQIVMSNVLKMKEAIGTFHLLSEYLILSLKGFNSCHQTVVHKSLLIVITVIVIDNRHLVNSQQQTTLFHQQHQLVAKQLGSHHAILGNETSSGAES